jgi:hypothetical protein
MEFRVLVVLANPDPSADIECELLHWHSSNNTNPDYIALSYVWGDQHPACSVTIRIHGSPVVVTPNLHSALKRLRHAQQIRHVWVDALCINQQNTIEKNQQVARMDMIYERSAFVVMWLGDAADDSDVAMASLLEMETGLGFTQWWSNDNQIVAIDKLLQRAYWKRIWICQEVVLAAHAFVCCGRFAVRWPTLVVFLVYLNIEDVSDFDNFKTTTLRLLLKVTSTRWTLSLVKIWLQKHCGISIAPFDALRLSRQREATQRHDYIFGIMAIANSIPVQIDYRIPLPQLFLTLVRNFIRETGSLDILSLCKQMHIAPVSSIQDVLDHEKLAFEKLEQVTVSNGDKEIVARNAMLQDCIESIQNFEIELGDAADKRTPCPKRMEHEELRRQKTLLEDVGLRSLPSWVPRWGCMGIVDSFYILLDASRQADDSASGSSQAAVEFLTRTGLQVLSTRGIMVDRIKYLSSPELDHVPSNYEAKSFDDKRFFDDIFRSSWEIWRNALANETVPCPYGGNQAQQEQAFLEASSLGARLEHPEVGRAMMADVFGRSEYISAQSAHSKRAYAQWSDVYRSGLQHRFFVTDGGLIGKGDSTPWGTIKEGDWICVIYGSKVPFIVRPVGLFYQLIGECCKSAFKP